MGLLRFYYCKKRKEKVMKKGILLLVSALFLSACGSPNPPVEEKIALENLSTLLSGDLYRNEVSHSNLVNVKEVENSGGNVMTAEEVTNIYSDETSFATATLKSEYESGTVYNNSYKRLATTRTYEGQKVFYLVADYEDEDLLPGIWYDSAYRLPVVSSGDSSGDGVSYLLESSLPGQLSKQATLLVNQFIQANLTGNQNLQGISINATVVNKDDKTTYVLDDFTYSFDDEGILNEISISFEIVVKDERMTSAKTVYEATQSRGSSDVYVNTLETTYELSYGERVLSTTNANIIDPEDYFLSEVNGVQAYIYGDLGDKEIVNANNLPLGEYVHIEAKDYAPAKAIDIELYPVSTSNSNVIAIEGDVFETVGQGNATIVVESQTGVVFELDVGVNIPPVQGISYIDSSSAIQNEDDGRTLYVGYTYDSINIFVRPSSASLDDLSFEISDPNVLNIEEVGRGDGYIEYSYEVLALNDSEKVSVTFFSLTNEEIKTTVEYRLATPLTNEQLTEKIINNTYRWDNFMSDGAYAFMTATAPNHMKLEYYNGDGTHYCTVTLDFEIDGMNVIITNCVSTATGEVNFIFNSGEITLDGNKITLRYNDTSRVNHFYIQEA